MASSLQHFVASANIMRTCFQVWRRVPLWRTTNCLISTQLSFHSESLKVTLFMHSSVDTCSAEFMNTNIDKDTSLPPPPHTPPWILTSLPAVIYNHLQVRVAYALTLIKRCVCSVLASSWKWAIINILPTSYVTQIINTAEPLLPIACFVIVCILFVSLCCITLAAELWRLRACQV